MEISDVKQRALLWGHLLVTLPAVAVLGGVPFFLRLFVFVPSWPYYLTTGLALAYQWYTAAMARWRTVLRTRGFSEGEVEEIAEKGGLVLPGASSAGLLALHTTAAGLCATSLSLWLAGLLVHWMPLIGQAAPPRGMDFYLQHFELANIVPAFLLGCVIVRKFPEFSTWAWVVPAAVIFYKLVTFVEPSVSVLASGDPWHRFSYYFVIQRVAPTLKFTRTSFDVSGPDPVRVLEQITAVAPFYCSIAYSLGAFATKTKALQRVWESFSREPDAEIIEPEEAGIVDSPKDSVEGALQRK
jgi:hypothetical protein